jgi:hypothetical protein
MSKSKAKGTTWETAVVDYLRGRGAVHAERRASHGNTDRGDIAGVPGVVIEAKNAAKVELGNWLVELQAEVINASAAVGAVWIKRRGRASPGDGYAVLTGEDLVTLLIEAGYIPMNRVTP